MLSMHRPATASPAGETKSERGIARHARKSASAVGTCAGPTGSPPQRLPTPPRATGAAGATRQEHLNFHCSLCSLSCSHFSRKLALQPNEPSLSFLRFPPNLPRGNPTILGLSLILNPQSFVLCFDLCLIRSLLFHCLDFSRCHTRYFWSPTPFANQQARSSAQPHEPRRSTTHPCNTLKQVSKQPIGPRDTLPAVKKRSTPERD